jgi:hypothetical protein
VRQRSWEIFTNHLQLYDAARGLQASLARADELADDHIHKTQPYLLLFEDGLRDIFRNMEVAMRPVFSGKRNEEGTECVNSNDDKYWDEEGTECVNSNDDKYWDEVGAVFGSMPWDVLVCCGWKSLAGHRSVVVVHLRIFGAVLKSM